MFARLLCMSVDIDLTIYIIFIIINLSRKLLYFKDGYIVLMKEITPIRIAMLHYREKVTVRNRFWFAVTFASKKRCPILVLEYPQSSTFSVFLVLNRALLTSKGCCLFELGVLETGETFKMSRIWVNMQSPLVTLTV